jgi:PAS domain S-box-containing protein
MANERLLIVEDEAIVAKELEERLKGLGYEVAGAVASGEEALSLVGSDQRLDLVLMDIVLKGKLDGIETAARIHALFDIPVVYVTAYADEGTLQRAKAGEPFGYILKPFSERDLHVAVEVALYKHRTEKALVSARDFSEALIRTANVMIIGLDRAGSISVFNEAAEVTTGYRRMDLEDARVFELLIPRDKYPAYWKGLPAVGRHGQLPKTFECPILTKNGEERFVSWQNSVLTLHGEAAGTICFGIDITERKKAETQLEQSLENARCTMDGAIRALETIVETRDSYTSGHQRRVASLAFAIAGEMHLPAGVADGIQIAGVIHDIGKVSVPAEILSKPNRLNKYEFGIVKGHSEAGYEILKGIDFPWPVATIVAQHHERIDGSGYPQALTGDAILIEAKILAVADVVEAMGSHRPYRPALSMDTVLEEISANSGILYDGAVVDACLQVLNGRKLPS